MLLTRGFPYDQVVASFFVIGLADVHFHMSRKNLAYNSVDCGHDQYALTPPPPPQHFELLSLLAHPNNAQFITSGRVIKPELYRPLPNRLCPY